MPIAVSRKSTENSISQTKKSKQNDTRSHIPIVYGSSHGCLFSFRLQSPENAGKIKIILSMKTPAALAARQIKQILNKEFPSIVFSVKSNNYSMGDSIRVSYTDGPTADKVEAKINHYQYGDFNGMEDIYEYTNCRADIPQTKYLFVERHMSDESKSELLNFVRAYWIGCENLDYNDFCHHLQESVSVLVNREFAKKDYYFINFEKELLTA